MKKIILVLLSLASTASAGPLINGNQINPQTAISIATFTHTGATPAAFTGAGGVAVTNSVDGSSFTAHGAGFRGAGTGLTGTAAALSIGGSAATATSASVAATATNVASGAAGQILYQSAGGTTAKLAAGNSHQILVGGASAPAWTDSAVSSSFTTTGNLDVGGNLTVGGSTLTTSGGVLSVPSQPGVTLFMNQSRAFNASAQTKMFWDGSNDVNQGMWVVSSSANVTVPASGRYQVNAGLPLTKNALATYWEMDVVKNGSRICTNTSAWVQSASTNATPYAFVTCNPKLTVGDVLDIRVTVDQSGSTANDQVSTRFEVVKWAQ